MRNLKKYLAVVLAVAMLISIVAPAIAAPEGNYSSEATKLNAMGLYQGVSTTSFDPNLGSTLDRQTAAVFLARLAGLEQEAKDSDLAEAKATLTAKFKDAAQVSDWAVKHLALYVDAGVIKGFPDGTFQPKGLVTGRQFCTMALKQLGYEVPVFEEAGKQFAEAAGLDAAQQTEFEVNTAIKKSILIGISFKALGTKESGKETTLVEGLVKSGVVASDKAEEAGFVVAPPAPTAAPTAEVTVAPTSVPATVYGAVYGAVTAVNDLPVGTLSTGSTVNKVFKFTVTAPVEQDMTISSFVAKKYGTAAANTDDVSKVYLVEGDTILVSGTLNNGEVRLNKSIVIAKGTTKTYCLAVDIAATGSTATRTVVLGLDSAASVVSTPAMAPFTAALQGGTYSIISASIGAITIITEGDQADTTVKVGEMNKDMGDFQITANGTEDLKLTNLTLTAVGLTASNFDNFYLYDRTLTKIDVKGVVSGSKVTFSFGDKAPTITKSNTKKFYLKGDILSGVNTSGQFKIDNSYDIIAKGQLSGANVGITTWTTAVSLMDTATDPDEALTVSAGTPTLTDTSNVPTKVVATSSTKGLIREWQITAPSEEMNITSIVAQVTGSGISACNVTFANFYITDDAGNVISGPIAAPATNVYPADLTFSNVNWYIPANTAKKFQLRATTASDTVTSIDVDARIKAGGLSYTLTATNTQSSIASAVPSGLTATKALVTAGTLTASKDPTSVNKNAPVGSKKVNVARYLVAATNDKIKVTKFRVTATTAGGINISTGSLSGFVSNMGLYVNGALKGLITATPTSGVYFDLDLSADPLYVEKDQTLQLEVRADLDQQPAGLNKYAFELTSATAYSNTTTVTANTTAFNDTNKGGETTVQSSGALAVTTPSSAQVISDKVVGDTEVDFVKANYTASYEDITLTHVQLKAVATTDTAAVKNIKVYDGTTVIGSYPAMSATIAGNTVTIALDSTKYPTITETTNSSSNPKTLTVKGELDKAALASGDQVTFYLVSGSDTKGTGKLSEKSVTSTGTPVVGGTLTKVNAKAEVAVASDSPSGAATSSSTLPLLKFTVKAVGGDVYLTPTAITMTTGGSVTGYVKDQASMKLFRVESNGDYTLVSALTAGGTFVVGDEAGDATVDGSPACGATTASGLAIAKDQTVTFVVKMNDTWTSDADCSFNVTLSGLKIADSTLSPVTAIYEATGSRIIEGKTLTIN